jgi:hypothetical protein
MLFFSVIPTSYKITNLSDDREKSRGLAVVKEAPAR